MHRDVGALFRPVAEKVHIDARPGTVCPGMPGHRPAAVLVHSLARGQVAPCLKTLPAITDHVTVPARMSFSNRATESGIGNSPNGAEFENRRVA